MTFVHTEKLNGWIKFGVWSSRVLIGLVFILSGFVKAIDLWGFVFKIDEYLTIWEFNVSRSLVFSAALLISSFEFIAGLMLLVGNYRKAIPILMLLMMAFMLPLTGYIWFKDPVADCGCFGDFLIVSNGITFLKNILITGILVFLVIYNKKVSGLYGPYIQWLTLLLSVFYIIIIGISGYNIQPLLDFRSFPVGSRLLTDSDLDNEEVDIDFIYEKDGQKKTFSSDDLPDSTWTFVERIDNPKNTIDRTEFFILEDGDNITEEVIDTARNQLLVIIPEYDKADASYTYLINEMNSYISEHDGSTVALIGGNSDDVEEWLDLSMADYPVYLAEPTLLKELSRGIVSMVYLDHGTIGWKRTASSIDPALFEAPARDNLIADLGFDGQYYLMILSLFLGGLFAVIFILDKTGRLIKWRAKLKKHPLLNQDSSSE